MASASRATAVNNTAGSSLASTRAPASPTTDMTANRKAAPVPVVMPNPIRGEAQAGQRHAEAQAASPVREDDHRHPKPGDERSGGFDH